MTNPRPTFTSSERYVFNNEGAEKAYEYFEFVKRDDVHLMKQSIARTEGFSVVNAIHVTFIYAGDIANAKQAIEPFDAFKAAVQELIETNPDEHDGMMGYAGDDLNIGDLASHGYLEEGHDFVIEILPKHGIHGFRAMQFEPPTIIMPWQHDDRLIELLD